jgi:hypothetical protein
MRKLIHALTVIVAATLAACSGGSDNTLFTDGGAASGGSTTASTLTLLTSSPQIPSDGASDATITALVRDTNNNVLPDVPVVFSSDSGSLVVSQPSSTDANGQLTATLSTAGDPTNRTITVSATAGSAAATVTVDVVGTTLAINGPASLPTGQTGDYNVVLTDAGGAGIGSVDVTVTSSNGNAISQSPVTTDSAGRASFTVTASNTGDDTLEASALGLIAAQVVTVSGDAFVFTTPAANTEIPLGSNQTVTVNWQQSNTPINGQPVSFSITRGSVSASSVNTDASGNATITVSATNAGPAVITATNGNGTSTQRVVEFVATQPDTLELQADPFTVAPQAQSTITAVVRDADGNLVKNQIVDFTLDDVTGGSLSVAQATTDSQGRAQTFYTASQTTSASEGVSVTATVRGTAVSGNVKLTVAQRELFLSAGTGNEIFEPNSAQYRIEYAVQVTDSQGNGVEGVTVQVNVLSTEYYKGYRQFPAGGNSWTTVVTATCADEDVNRNGILDAGEDANNSGRIEAGNVATVSAQNGGGGSFVTDQDGFGIVDVLYPQEFAYYVKVKFEASTSVQGTESATAKLFVLPGSANDFNNENNAPPGVVSPFGQSNTCADTL